MIADSTEGALAAEAADTATTVVDPAPFSLHERLLRPQSLLSFAAAIAIVAFSIRGLRIDVASTLAYIQQADPWLLLLALVAFYTTFPVRVLRWRIMLEQSGIELERGGWASFPALLEYLYLSWFANCIVPAKLGDAYRGYLLKHNGGVPFSTAMGTIFAERLLDVLGLFGTLLLAGWFTFGAHIPDGTQVVFGFGTLLAAAIVLGLFAMRYFGSSIRGLLPWRLGEFYGRFEHAALHSFSPRVVPRLLALTGAIWLLEGLRLYCVIASLSGGSALLPFAAVVFVALTGSLLTALPLTPAGLGLVESVSAVVLAFLGVNLNLGTAVSLLDRVVSYWSVVLGGLCLYIFSKRK